MNNRFVRSSQESGELRVWFYNESRLLRFITIDSYLSGFYVSIYI